MSAAPRARRGWLALTYALAAVLAQAGHPHGAEAEGATRCVAGCDSPGPHLSGHPAPDLGRGHDDCPACQLRSGHITVSAAPAPTSAVVAGATPEPPAPLRRPALHRGPTCRAPPLGT